MATLLVTTVSGCAQTKSWWSGLKEPASTDQIILGAPAADVYLNELYRLSTGDPATQAEIYADAKSASTLTPGPSANLRFALVLATPSHAGTDPQLAQRLLRQLLAQTELLTQVEISLATVYLRTADELIILGSESRRLRASSPRAVQIEDPATSKRLVTVEAENRRLRRDLKEAQEKLDAITSIERSIRDQE